MYINICLNIHGYFSGVLLRWNFQFLFVTFFFSFVSVDHFQIKPAMADLSLISDTTIFIKIHFDLPNINIHFFLLKYISVIFTAIARLVTFLNITINIHGHLMCSISWLGNYDRIFYFIRFFFKFNFNHISLCKHFFSRGDVDRSTTFFIGSHGLPNIWYNLLFFVIHFHKTHVKCRSETAFLPFSKIAIKSCC